MSDLRVGQHVRAAECDQGAVDRAGPYGCTVDEEGGGDDDDHVCIDAFRA